MNVSLLLLAFIEMNYTTVLVVFQEILWFLVKENNLFGDVDLTSMDLLIVGQQMHHQPIIAPLSIHVRFFLFETINIARLLHFNILQVVDPRALIAENIVKLISWPAYILPTRKLIPKRSLRHLVRRELL